jgi:hypothetical protein
MHRALQQAWPENLLWCSGDDEDQPPSLSPQQVERLLKALATDLGNTGLPMQQQHWVLFSVLGAYSYCKSSLRDDITEEDGETDAVPMRLRQVIHQTLQVSTQVVPTTYKCCQPTVVIAAFADMAARCIDTFKLNMCQMLLVRNALMMPCASTNWCTAG